MTTSQVAEMLCVSAATIQKLCKKGLLKHWFVPGSKHRRIERKDVLEFLKSSDMPQEYAERFEVNNDPQHP